MIWRDYFDKNKGEFNTDKSVVGRMSSPIDIHYKNVFGYYLVGFSSRQGAKCSVVGKDINPASDTLICDSDCRLL